MSDCPFFSVIIPTLNSEKTLKTCLESILTQTFEDFEILIIDGLSKDETLNIASSFNDKRVKIYTALDNGIYDAMNKGIEVASGEWLYFLGSDDYLLENVFNQIFKTARKNGKYKLIYGNIQFHGEFLIRKLNIKKYDIIRGTICHQAIFYNASLFEDLGLYSYEYLYISDWIFNIKVFLSSNKVKYIDFTIAVFGTSGKSNENMEITIAEYNHYRKRVVSELGISQYIFYKLHNLSRKIVKSLL